MPLRITARHFDLTDPDRSYIEKKTERLLRLVGDYDEMAVVLDEGRNDFGVEISFRAGKLKALTKSRASTVRAAIDGAFDTLFNQVSREKKKRREKKPETIRTGEAALESE